MYKCSVCKGDTKYDEFTDYKHMVCINCEEEHNEEKHYVFHGSEKEEGHDEVKLYVLHGS